MQLTPEIHATIIKVAGDWALAMASTAKILQASSMSEELEQYFPSCYDALLNMLNVVDTKDE